VTSIPETLPAARGRAAAWAPRPGVVAAWILLALVALAVAWPSLLAARDPNAADPATALAGPGAGHLFGTDELGRDVLSRVVYGARPSLFIGAGSTLTALVAGSLLGVLAATSGRAVDGVVMRVADVLLAFPGLLLALLVIAAIGPGTTDAMIALACASVPGFIRIARSQGLVIRRADYVRAAVVLGRGRAAIQLRHVLPNALPPLLAFAMINIGAAIISGATLSFLGLGPPAPTPEWGAMLSTSRGYLSVAWAPAVFPGLAITVTVIAVNVAGRDLRRRFEGRQAVPRA